MNDCIKIGVVTGLVLLLAVVGAWLARNDPRPAWRAAAAVMSMIIVSIASMEIGGRLSNLRGPWTESQGYSCGETKVIGLILILGACVLIRAVWRSFRSEEGEAARGAKLAFACLGLALVGFTLAESEAAHDRFHRAQHQAETRR
jgi:hypothetical protein